METYQESKKHNIEKIFAKAKEKNIPLKNEPEMMKILIKNQYLSIWKKL